MVSKWFGGLIEKAKKWIQQANATEPDPNESPNPFLPRLRHQVLTRTFFEKKFPIGQVLCAAMDWNNEPLVATLVAFHDGSVSLYSDRGGGMLGLGEKKQVRVAAERFLEQAERSLESLHASTEFPLPESGHSVLYVVTGGATYSSGPIPTKTLARNDHEHHALFRSADQILTEIRLSQGTD